MLVHPKAATEICTIAGIATGSVNFGARSIAITGLRNVDAAY
jgi:hypothetical protein